MSESYDQRVSDQIKQFKNPEVLKKLPEMHHLYMRTHITPKVRELFGVNSALQIYDSEFAKALTSGPDRKLLSVGSGECQVEARIAKALISRGVEDFEFDCLELSPDRNQRAREMIKAEGLEPHFNILEKDMNQWQPEHNYAGVMAHHVLHHIVDLEALFASMNACMSDTSVFVSIDMIGRNGHMRWPECEALIQSIWKTLPDKYKYNHQFQKLHPEFVNWDCAQRGFEGIRAQDILPLLLVNFDCEKFLGYGNLPDMFVERGYGHNYDENDPQDVAFINSVALLNEFYLGNGFLKPTIMFSIWKKKGLIDAGNTAYYPCPPREAVRETDFSRELMGPAHTD